MKHKVPTGNTLWCHMAVKEKKNWRKPAYTSVLRMFSNSLFWHVPPTTLTHPYACWWKLIITEESEKQTHLGFFFFLKTSQPENIWKVESGEMIKYSFEFAPTVFLKLPLWTGGHALPSFISGSFTAFYFNNKPKINKQSNWNTKFQVFNPQLSDVINDWLHL